MRKESVCTVKRPSKHISEIKEREQAVEFYYWKFQYRRRKTLSKKPRGTYFWG